MREIECPYCEHQYDLCHDDGAFYREDEQEEEECPNCEKKFLVSASCSWSWEGEKADCLNDGEHDWVKDYPERYLKEYPELAKKEHCSQCNEKRLLTNSLQDYEKNNMV